MHRSMLKETPPERRALASLSATLLATLLAACSTPPSPQAEKPRPAPMATPTQPATPPSSVQPTHPASLAATPREYRRDAARHLYERNADRIYKGRLPPMLYAIGVLDVELDRQGRVLGTQWKRAPTHAPEVMAAIEKTVREAAPYPAPSRMGKVVYTDVWLWHQSGRFQLDTLTEGQD